MRIVCIVVELQQFLWFHLVFRHINSGKTSSGRKRPNRKSAENQAHFVPLSELSAPYCLFGWSKLKER